MIAIIRLMVYVGLIRWSIEDSHPLACAIIHALVVSVTAVMFAASADIDFLRLGVVAGIDFAATLVVFWLLGKLDGSWLWWILMIIGIPLLVLV